jgi:hypothetical protein
VFGASKNSLLLCPPLPLSRRFLLSLALACLALRPSVAKKDKKGKVVYPGFPVPSGVTDGWGCFRAGLLVAVCELEDAPRVVYNYCVSPTGESSGQRGGGGTLS